MDGFIHTRRNQTQAYDQRYRHRLNMPGPGTAMLKRAGILTLAGLILRFLQLNAAAYIRFGLSGIIFIVLAVLPAVEPHQDKVPDGIAMREERQEEE